MAVPSTPHQVLPRHITYVPNEVRSGPSLEAFPPTDVVALNRQRSSPRAGQTGRFPLPPVKGPDAQARLAQVAGSVRYRVAVLILLTAAFLTVSPLSLAGDQGMPEEAEPAVERLPCRAALPDG